MDRAGIISLIQQGLGWRSDKQAEIIVALDQAQRLLEMGRSLPKFLLKRRQTLVVPAGSAGVVLPAGFIRVYDDDDEGAPYYVNGTTNESVFLEKVSRRTAILRFGASDPGKPLAYSVEKDAGLVYMYPDRDAQYSVVWTFYAKDVVPSLSNTANLWMTNAPDVLVGTAGMSMAMDLAKDRAYKKFQNLYLVAWSSMFADAVLEDEADGAFSMGESL